MAANVFPVPCVVMVHSVRSGHREFSENKVKSKLYVEMDETSIVWQSLTGLGALWGWDPATKAMYS